MSADNWTACPKCNEAHLNEISAMTKKLQMTYGKIPVAEYMEKHSELESLAATHLEETLREDYEQGIQNGEYFVAYSGHCSKCHWEFKYKHEQQVFKGSDL